MPHLGKHEGLGAGVWLGFCLHLGLGLRFDLSLDLSKVDRLNLDRLGGHCSQAIALRDPVLLKLDHLVQVPGLRQ